MTDPRVAPIKQALVATAGGFLRNPVTHGTCSRCFTPLEAAPICGTCQAHLTAGRGPDLLGFMTYAGYLDPISQSGYAMRGYKNPSIPKGSLWETVALLAALGLIGHVRCPGRILSRPVAAWATVPSLPPKPSPSTHPLSEIARRLARQGAAEIVLQGTDNVVNPRGIDANNFSVQTGNAAGQHVLLLDDTWTGGGHVMSATMALRAAGCTHVSALLLARWLSIGWEATTDRWARRELTLPDYQASTCPWTQAECPPRDTGVQFGVKPA